MAQGISRAEVWMLDLARPEKRRPVLVLSRPALIQALHTVTVAAITSTRRDSPIEVDLGREDGLKSECCVNLANVFTVRQSELRNYVTTLREDKMLKVCAALRIAVGCDGPHE